MGTFPTDAFLCYKTVTESGIGADRPCLPQAGWGGADQ